MHQQQAQAASAPSAVPVALLKQARASGKLNLSSRGLTSVPDAVLRINEDVGKGQVVDFGASHQDRWWDQVPLTTLVLASNQLTSLPLDLPALLPCLTTLDVHDNPLSRLPDHLTHLGDLVVLNAAHCQLDALPATLGDLDALTALVLDHNRLAALPESVGRLRRLESLVRGGGRATSVANQCIFFFFFFVFFVFFFRCFTTTSWWRFQLCTRRCRCTV